MISKYSIGPISAMELIVRAKKERMWVKSGKHWFTPEQFAEYAFKIKKGAYITFREEPKLANPLDALKEARANVERVQKRYDDFLERVLTYYQNNR